MILQASGAPNASFYESQIAMGGMLTCVACVLPESIFNARQSLLKQIEPVYEYWAKNDDTPVYYEPGHQYYDLITLLRSSRLAS
jgi:hypothetical protein